MAQLNYDTHPVWEAWQRDELRLPRCRACGSWASFPSGGCPRCWSEDVTLEEVAPQGRLVSFSVPRVAPGAEPAVTAVVDLDAADGVRLVGRLAGCAPEELAVGQRVVVGFGGAAGQRVPTFRPAAS